MNHLFLVLLCISFLSLSLQEDITATRSFMLQKDIDSRKTTVRLGKVHCDFRFSTVDCGQIYEEKLEKEQKTVTQATTKNYKEIFENLFLNSKENVCFERVQGYWSFRLCLKESFTQSHGNEVYVLGYDNDHKIQEKQLDEIIFHSGGECDVVGKKIKRETVVKFMCGPSARLASISEPTTCNYRAIVTHPDLCGEGSPFDKFEELHSADSVSNVQIESRVTNPDDFWFHQIEQSMDGTFVCTVKNILRDLKEKPSVCFQYIEMQIYDSNQANQEDEETAHSVKEQVNSKGRLLQRFSARHYNRVPFISEEVTVNKEESTITSVKDKFTGSLEYIRLESK